MNESILQQFNCCVSCYFIAFFTVFLTLFMSSPSSHKKLESPLTESIGEEKKMFSLFVMSSPIFYEALGFSLLSLYVNPALCLQPIFSLSTCDTCPVYMGFRPTVLAFSFCSPHPTNKILKKTCLDLSSFWVLISMAGLLSFKYIHAEAVL